MNSELPSREQAIELLREKKCSPQIIDHCIAVAEIGIKIANKLQRKGLKINVELVEVGALLHDIGRSKNQTVDHAIIGAQIAQSIGFPEPLIRIIKRHVGAGITEEEVKLIGWPKDVYVPQTLEEKIVSYADKLISESKLIPIETEINRLQNEGKKEAAERIRKLHLEIENLIGDQ